MGSGRLNPLTIPHLLAILFRFHGYSIKPDKISKRNSPYNYTSGTDRAVLAEGTIFCEVQLNLDQ